MSEINIKWKESLSYTEYDFDFDMTNYTSVDEAFGAVMEQMYDEFREMYFPYLDETQVRKQLKEALHENND